MMKDLRVYMATKLVYYAIVIGLYYLLGFEFTVIYLLACANVKLLDLLDEDI